MAKPARALCFLLPILVAVPFDPQWPDFERARRGVLLVLVGLGLLAAGPRARLPARPLLWLLALAGAALASTAWARDRLAAVEQGTYLLALFALPLLLPARARQPFFAGFAAALLVTSGYGLAQCLGFGWPAHYTVPHEPVTTLGNRNVAAEWTAAATPLALLAHPVLGWVCAAAADVYLWAQGGRAGRIAFHAGVLTYVVYRTGRVRISREALGWTTALLVAAALAGSALKPDRAAPAGAAGAARSDAAPGTGRVRLLLWRRTAAMTADHPLLGVGAGNFRVRFPPYRDPAEIEVSSFGHRIATRVTTPHNDLLQIGSELGLLGSTLLLLFFAALWRMRAALGPEAILGLAAFAPLAMLRAPVGNAPAAAAFVVALAAGTQAAAGPALAPGLRRALRLLGIPFLLLGLSVLAGEGAGAAFLRAKRVDAPRAGLAALDRAVALDPFETDWRLLRAQVHYRPGRRVPETHLAGTLADLDAVLARRPDEYQGLVELGYLGLVHPRLQPRGGRAAARLVSLDPRHPQGLFLLSEYAFLAGDVPGGLAALERLGQKDPIRAKWQQMKRLTRDETNPKKQLRYARVQLELKRLGRKLFPADPDFR